MTDATPGGWPDAARPGYPQNPERTGSHALRDASGLTRILLWQSPRWISGWGHIARKPSEAALTFSYLGPCLTPAEVTAQVAAARREEREACARIAEGRVYKERYRTWPWWINRDGSEGNRSADSDIVQHADKIAAAIRARGDA